jgi:short-subunit dehydrogenase
VARAGYRGFQKRRREIIPGVIPWALARSAAFTPRPLMLLIVEMLQKSRMPKPPAPARRAETLQPRVS